MAARALDRAAIKSALVAAAPRRKSRRLKSKLIALTDYADCKDKQTKSICLSGTCVSPVNTRKMRLPRLRSHRTKHRMLLQCAGQLFNSGHQSFVTDFPGQGIELSFWSAPTQFIDFFEKRPAGWREQRRIRAQRSQLFEKQRQCAVVFGEGCGRELFDVTVTID